MGGKESFIEKLRKIAAEKFLEGEPELVGVFKCQWEGVTNPAEIGSRLGMQVDAVVKARKRLDVG